MYDLFHVYVSVIGSGVLLFLLGVVTNYVYPQATKKHGINKVSGVSNRLLSVDQIQSPS